MVNVDVAPFAHLEAAHVDVTGDTLPFGHTRGIESLLIVVVRQGRRRSQRSFGLGVTVAERYARRSVVAGHGDRSERSWSVRTSNERLPGRQQGLEGLCAWGSGTVAYASQAAGWAGFAAATLAAFALDAVSSGDGQTACSASRSGRMDGERPTHHAQGSLRLFARRGDLLVDKVDGGDALG